MSQMTLYGRKRSHGWVVSVVLHGGVCIHENVCECGHSQGIILLLKWKLQEALLPKASLPLDVDPGSERESMKGYQGWPACTVAQSLPICVFSSSQITLLDVVAFVFK